jgi:hypothetical protein
MPIVIGGGQSVKDYDGLHLANLSRLAFTFCVNDSAGLFACDVVVALDPDWILKWKDGLYKLGKPIITRKWDMLGHSGLDLIELPNDIPYRLSGMVACKVSDSLAAHSGDRKSYVIGMDASKGHYYDDKGDAGQFVTKDDYEAMGLTHTVNLGVHSKISAWPKSSKLPSVKKIITDNKYRAIALAWIRGEAAMGRLLK